MASTDLWGVVHYEDQTIATFPTKLARDDWAGRLRAFWGTTPDVVRRDSPEGGWVLDEASGTPRPAPPD